jgi:hypothetical protein
MPGRGINMPFSWNFNKFFRRLNNTVRYQRIQVDIPEDEKKILREITVPLEVGPQTESGMLKSLKDSRGKTIIVPIWKTEMARGSQN